MAAKKLLKKEQDRLYKEAMSMASWFDGHDIDISNPTIAGYLRIMLQCARAIKSYSK